MNPWLQLQRHIEQVWWCTLGILALRRQRHEGQKFKGILDSVSNLRPATWDLVFKKKKAIGSSHMWMYIENQPIVFVSPCPLERLLKASVDFANSSNFIENQGHP